MLFIRSLLFTMGFCLSTLLFAPLSLLTFPLPFLVRYRIITQWTRFNLWWLATVCALRYRVEGRENIPPTTALIFSKHQSAWETLALQRIFPPQVWLVKRELLWIPFFGWGLAMLDPIAIDRKAGRQAMRRLLEEGGRRLAAGRWIVIFPEGTRVAPGHKARYALGGALLAEKSGCPVVPVAHNAGEYWPRHGFLKRPGTIRVCIGPPIVSRGKSAVQINRLAEEWIEGKMKEIGRGGREEESGKR